MDEPLLEQDRVFDVGQPARAAGIAGLGGAVGWAMAVGVLIFDPNLDPNLIISWNMLLVPIAVLLALGALGAAALMMARNARIELDDEAIAITDYRGRETRVGWGDVQGMHLTWRPTAGPSWITLDLLGHGPARERLARISVFAIISVNPPRELLRLCAAIANRRDLAITEERRAGCPLGLLGWAVKRWE